MPANRDRQEFIDTIVNSPAAVKAHDKEAWMSIFAQYNMVEDPVGSKAHVSGGFDSNTGTRAPGALSRFYDTYISPNDITFHVERDTVCGYHVVRDIFLEIRMSPKVSIDVPMHALYELVEENGELRITRLAAHWELVPMVKQVMGKGFASLGVLCALGARMISIQGISGVMGFTQGFSGIGDIGKTRINHFVDALNNKNFDLIREQFSEDSQRIAFPHGKDITSPNELTSTFSGKLTVKKILAAGYVCSCSCEIEQDGNTVFGAAIFEFNAKNKKIDIARFYFE